MNKPSAKNVLFFDHTAKMGGGEISLFHLVQRINRERYFPVVVLGAEGELNQKLKACGIETHVLPLSENVANTRKDSLGHSSLLRLGTLVRTVRYAFRLARFIRKRKIDFIHTNSLKADVIGGIAARLARVPVIWHVRDRIADDYLPARLLACFAICAALFLISSSSTRSDVEDVVLPNPNGVAASKEKVFVPRSSVVIMVWFMMVYRATAFASIEHNCGTIHSMERDSSESVW
jgi:hypothetical protein